MSRKGCFVRSWNLRNLTGRSSNLQMLRRHSGTGWGRTRPRQNCKRAIYRHEFVFQTRPWDMFLLCGEKCMYPIEKSDADLWLAKWSESKQCSALVEWASRWDQSLQSEVVSHVLCYPNIQPTSNNERSDRSSIRLYRLEHEQFCRKMESRKSISANTKVVHTTRKSISSVIHIQVTDVNSLQRIVNVIRCHSSNQAGE